jgi:hypothetical protein
MKKSLLIGFSAMLLILSVVASFANGIPETTVSYTILPGEYDGNVLIILDEDTVDVKVDSDVPVDIYILKQEQLPYVESGSFDYEKKWEGKTSLNVDYKVESLDTMYYILIMNPSSSETANVDLEYKIYQEIGEDAAEEAIDEACCGGTIIAGLILIGTVIAVGIYAKRRGS